MRRKSTVRWTALRRRSERHLSLAFAKSDRTQSMCPGLFTPLSRGRPRLALDVKYCHGDTQIHVLGVQLGAADLAVLLAVLAHCGVSRGVAPAHPKGALGQNLRRALAPKGADLPTGQAQDQASAACRVGYRELARTAGMGQDGRSMSVMLDSLRRLAALTMFERRDGVEWSSRLLGFVADHDQQKLVITVNHGATQALTGLRPTAYVSLPEHHSLQGDTARVLHHYLSAWIGPGHAQDVGLEPLVRRVWPHKGGPETERDRAKKVRQAMHAIGALRGWRITEPRPGMYHIRRSKVLPELSPKAKSKVRDIGTTGA